MPGIFIGISTTKNVSPIIEEEEKMLLVDDEGDLLVNDEGDLITE